MMKFTKLSSPKPKCKYKTSAKTTLLQNVGNFDGEYKNVHQKVTNETDDNESETSVGQDQITQKVGIDMENFAKQEILDDGSKDSLDGDLDAVEGQEMNVGCFAHILLSKLPQISIPVEAQERHERDQGDARKQLGNIDKIVLLCQIAFVKSIIGLDNGDGLMRDATAQKTQAEAATNATTDFEI